MPATLGTLLWARLVRVTLLQHVTWSVNSLCHVVGARPFTTRRHDRATNLWPLALWLRPRPSGAGASRHSQALLKNTPHSATDYLPADLRDPGVIMRRAEEVLEFGQPATDRWDTRTRAAG